MHHGKRGIEALSIRALSTSIALPRVCAHLPPERSDMRSRWRYWKSGQAISTHDALPGCRS